MNTILKLSKNEIIKQLKKKSIIILMIIIMSLGIIIPIASKFIKNANNSAANSNLAMLEQAGEVNVDKSDQGKIADILNKADKAFWQIKVDGNIGFDDWREKAVQNYKSNTTDLLYAEALKNGISKDTILKNGIGFDPNEIERLASLSKENLNKEIEKIQNKIERDKDIILNENYIEFLKDEIKQNKNNIKQLEISKEELLKGEKSKDTEEQIKNIDGSILLGKEKLEIDKYRLENKIPFEKNNWKSNTLLNIQELTEKNNREMLTIQQFGRDHTMKMTYDEYVESYKKEKKELKEKIEINWNSLKNDIPQMEFSNDARGIVSKGYDIFIVLAVIMIIIIGGGIVSTEFTKGTIRLLLVRPIKRWKVLSAKLLALLIMGLGIVIGGTIILVITSGIVYGFSGFGNEILSVVDGTVIETSFVVYLIKNMIISCGSLIFMTGVVFFISTVVKNTALAVGLGTVLYLGAVPLVMLLGGLGISVANTPIPYINQSFLNLTPSLTEALRTSVGITFNSSFGAIMVAIIGVILIGISYIHFNSKDIKN